MERLTEMKSIHITLLLSVLSLIGIQSAVAREHNPVVIETITKAYTVLLALPREKVEEVKLKLKGKDGVRIVDWQDFIANRKKYISAVVIKNEYENSRLIEGITRLLERYPATPFGVTWNGGVAITYLDYKHAKKTYKRYKEDPAEYEKTRNRDPRADPVKPAWHFGPLLGW
jgi:hypothetical protein